MSGKEELPEEKQQKEGLFYKIHYRLKRLYEVMQENRNHIAKEREDLQELISDISHQVKTPIANLKMINNTLLEQEVPAQKQQELDVYKRQGRCGYRAGMYYLFGLCGFASGGGCRCGGSDDGVELYRDVYKRQM